MIRPAACRGCPFDDGGKVDAFVGFHGPRNAKLCAIAESPGEDEVKKEEPLVGRTGYEFNVATKVAGIKREEVLLGNTILCRPPRQFSLDDRGWMQAIHHCYRNHVGPIVDTVQPQSVILMGAAATLAFTGFRPVVRTLGGRKVTLNGVENIRGSAYRAQEMTASVLRQDLIVGPAKWGGSNPWLVPTLHPAFILRGNQHLKPLLAHDMDRAVRFANGSAAVVNPDPKLFDLHAEPYDVLYNLTSPANPNAIGLDVEVNDSGKVTMIGIGTEAHDGRVWVTALTEGIRSLLKQSDADKTAHNIMFDLKMIASEVKEPWFDTMIAASLVQPALPKSLHEVTSLHGMSDSYWYWKDLDHNPRTQHVTKLRLGLPDTFVDFDRLYNAFDVWWMMRDRASLIGQMRHYKLIEMFRNIQMALVTELIKLESNGMPVDRAVMKEMKQRAQDQIALLEVQAHEIVAMRTTLRANKELSTVVALADARSEIAASTFDEAHCREHPDYNGRVKRTKCPTCLACWEMMRPVYNESNKIVGSARGKAERAAYFKSGSTKDWQWVLFAPKEVGGFGLKSSMKTKLKKAESVGKDAIRGLLATADLEDDVRALLLARFNIARLSSRISRYLSSDITEDNRMHPAYSMHATLNGRFASGTDETDGDKPSSQYHINAMNYPEDCRRIVVAPVGYEFVSFDYSQIEAWTTAMGVWKVTGSRAYWNMLSTPGLDIHQMTADLMTTEIRKRIADHPPIARYPGKRVRHLWTYGGTAKVMSKILAGDGVTYRIAQAGERALELLHPDIVEYKKMRIRHVSKSMMDRNPFGRVCFYTVGKKGTEIVVDEPNVPISWWPSSTAHDIAKLAWLKLKMEMGYWPQCRIINHMHDSWLFEVPQIHFDRDAFIRKISDILTAPVHALRQYHPDGLPFVPRVNIEIGTNWAPSGHEHGKDCAPGTLCLQDENATGLTEIEVPILT